MNPVEPATARYIETTATIAPLSRDEEIALFTRIRADGDRCASDRVVRAHLKCAVYVAHKYRFYGVPLADLIAEGNLGLMRALEKFDIAHGVRFSTYAAHWIRAYVVTHVLRSWSLVGGSAGVLRSGLFFRLRRERARLEALHGPGGGTLRLLADRMSLSEDTLGRLLERIDSRDLSLDAPLHAESTATLADRLAATGDTEEAYDERRTQRRLSVALSAVLPVLDRRERFIAESRWLADSESELSLADIGRELGISRERARQLETRARAKLRRALTERYGERGEWLPATAA